MAFIIGKFFSLLLSEAKDRKTTFSFNWVGSRRQTTLGQDATKQF
jgi:hypothetical protein